MFHDRAEQFVQKKLVKTLLEHNQHYTTTQALRIIHTSLVMLVTLMFNHHILLPPLKVPDSSYDALFLQDVKMEYCCHIWAGVHQYFSGR